MNIVVANAEGSTVPVTIIRVEGDVDGSNYNDLIANAEHAVDSGAVNILLDLTNVNYMSTAGMVALQSITKLLRGERGGTEGWSAIKDVAMAEGSQSRLKLLNPGDRITGTLDALGLAQFFPVFTDEAEAVASFK